MKVENEIPMQDMIHKETINSKKRNLKISKSLLFQIEKRSQNLTM